MDFMVDFLGVPLRFLSRVSQFYVPVFLSLPNFSLLLSLLSFSRALRINS